MLGAVLRSDIPFPIFPGIRTKTCLFLLLLERFTERQDATLRFYSMAAARTMFLFEGVKVATRSAQKSRGLSA